MWLRVHEKDTPKRAMLAKVVPNIARHLLQNEIDMRNSLWHANIAAICAAYTSKRSCTLLMQPYGFIDFNFILTLFWKFSASQTLLEYITSSETISEGRIAMFISQLLSALQHMHAKNIAHLDLRVDW